MMIDAKVYRLDSMIHQGLPNHETKVGLAGPANLVRPTVYYLTHTQPDYGILVKVEKASGAR